MVSTNHVIRVSFLNGPPPRYEPCSSTKRKFDGVVKSEMFLIGKFVN